MKTTHLQKLCHQMFASYLAVRWLATLIWSQKLAELNSVWLVWFLASELKGCCFTRMSQTKHFHQTYAQLRGVVGGLALPRQVRVYFFLSVAGSCSHVPFFISTSSCPRSPLWLTITFHMWSPALAANAEVCPNVARRCSFDGSFAVDVVLTQVF